MIESTRYEGSIIIADFLGWEHKDDIYKFPNLYPMYNIDDEENSGWTEDDIDNAQFHCSLDWLKIPVDKFREIEDYWEINEDALSDILEHFDAEEIFLVLVESIKQIKK